MTLIPEATHSQRHGSVMDSTNPRRDFSKDIAYLERIMKQPRVEKTVAFTLRKSPQLD